MAAAAAAALTRSGGGFLVVVPSAFIKCGSRRILPLVSSSTDLPLLRSNEKASGGYDCRLFSPSSLPYTCSRRAGRTYSSMPHAAAAETNQEASVHPPPSYSEDSDPVKTAVDALDIRVGRILRAWRHPEADSLYVEEVDVGEPEPRTICSGLVNYITLDRLQDIKVVVLANLKPRNMRGIKSNGMLMAASDASHETVELLVPPEGSVPGERIWFGAEEEKGKQPDAATPNQVQKKKIWEYIQPHLKTTDTCIVVLGVHPMRTSAGVVLCTSLKDANIS